MKRKKTEKNNFPYNMLKAFEMEQENYPDDIYDTVMYLLHLIENTEEDEKMILLYFQEGKSNKEIGSLLHISPNKVRCHIQAIGNEMRKHERYCELIQKGKKQYEQEHDKEQDSVNQMCISDLAKSVLMHCGLHKAADVMKLSVREIKELRYEEHNKKHQLSEKMCQEILNDLIKFYDADKSKFTIINKKELSYPSNLLFECGFGIISGNFSDEFLQQIDNLLCETDSSESKLCYKRTLLHFREKKTYQKIAERCCVRCDTVRESVSKMTGRLKQPSIARKMMHLVQEEMKQNKMLTADETMQYFIALYQQKGTEINPAEIKTEHLHFTVRTYHILKRNQLMTVQDILDKGAEGILRIENIGAVCFEEIADSMIHEFGANPREWKYRAF